MKAHTKVVWLGYASIVFSIVWGVPGLALAWYALRLGKNIPIAHASANVRRDVRGGIVLARIGFALSTLVVVMIGWILLSTYLLW